MTVLNLTIAPDSCLSTKCEKVDEITDEIRTLLDDMLETMHANHGCGLAANQVGINKQLVVIDISDNEEEPQPIKLINLELLWASEEKEPFGQGCLSVPFHSSNIVRSKRVKVRYMDETGKTQEIEAEGYLAHCLQHEIDHINGTLIIDHISSLKRKMAIRKIAKAQKYDRR